MPKYQIISNINIEHIIEADTEEQALEKHANEVELPKEYISNSWELEQINPLCIYCNNCDNNNPSEHFQCDHCGVGMCDDCYDDLTEHDGHYHRPYEDDNWDDERKPEYLCDCCVKYYKYKS